MSEEPKEALPLWKLNGNQLILEAGALLSAIAFFAALPFAPLYLADRTSLSKPVIGLVVGGIALTAAFGGMLGGMLVDRFGAVRLLQIGLASYVAVYGLLTTVRNTAVIVLLLLSLGVFRLFVEPGGKKLLSLAAEDDGRLFRLRYMTMCAGGILGPLIGSLLYTASTVLFFLVPGVFYLGYLGLVTARRRALSALEGNDTEVRTHYSLRETVRDRRLLAATSAGLTIFFVFSQLESMIPLILRDRYGDRASSTFAGLFITNAVLALVLQVPIYWISRKVGRSQFVTVGCLAFALSFVCYWAGANGLVWFFVGIVFWTVGEGILLPMPDMAVHEIADEARKGAYFGFAEIRYLGFFLGPIAGGLFLSASAPVYFALMGATVFGCAPLLIRRFTAPVDSAGKGVVASAVQ